MREIFALFKGLYITFKHNIKNMFKNPFTVQYPDEKRLLPERARWILRLQRHEDGTERCIACQLCAAICPSEAIYIEGDENPVDNPIGKGQRYASVWMWDAGRCLYCGFCVEACPDEVIIMSDVYELATDKRKDLIFDKNKLFVPIGVMPKQAWMGFYRNKEQLDGKPVLLAKLVHEKEENVYAREKKEKKRFYENKKFMFLEGEYEDIINPKRSKEE
ncbi:MAG: NADH-quinone oxidoreductase subunit I [candidate division WOR-3 bacterium]